MSKRIEICTEALELEPEPFKNVHYFLPRREDDVPDSDEPPEGGEISGYNLADIYHSLDLLLAEVPDPSNTMDAFFHYVKDNWHDGKLTLQKAPQAASYEVRTWADLAAVPDDVLGPIVYGGLWTSIVPKLRREFEKLTSPPIFPLDGKSNKAVYLGGKICDLIKPKKVTVIDVYRVPSMNQAFVVGDVMRNIEEMYHREKLADLPHLVIFIDELNTFAPPGRVGEAFNPITEQIREIARKGRGRSTALFGAEQFKSQVDQTVWGNCTLHAVGRTGSAELRTPPYAQLDEFSKRTILNLKQGEIVLSSNIWQHAVKVVFPRPPYKRPSH